MTEHFARAETDGEQAAGTGPLAAEALRLMSTVQDWAQGWGEHGPGGPGGANAGPECQWCPICQFIAVLRGERPEIIERVTEAGTAIVAALRMLVESAANGGATVTPDRHASPKQSPRVQKINLGDEA
jgi:hypothetical protein